MRRPATWALPADTERALDVAPTAVGREAGLAGRRPDPLQHIDANLRPGKPTEPGAEPDGLVEAAPHQPEIVQRDGNQKVGLGDQWAASRRIQPPSRQTIAPALPLEGQHQITRDVTIDDRSTGPVRRPGDGRWQAAQPVPAGDQICRDAKRDAAMHAQWRGQEVQLRPELWLDRAGTRYLAARRPATAAARSARRRPQTGGG